MKIKGRFHIWPAGKYHLKEVVENSVVDEGEEAFLKMILQASDSDVSAGGNFYLGACANVSSDGLTLSTLTGEPTSAGGYARQALARNGTGWPTISQVNGNWRGLSAIASFSASGADFSTSFWRLFICNVSSGTSGKLFSISGPLPSAKLVTDGETYNAQYELYLD